MAHREEGVPIVGMSLNFDEFPDDFRKKYEETHFLVEVMLPRTWMKHLAMTDPLTIEKD